MEIEAPCSLDPGIETAIKDSAAVRKHLGQLLTSPLRAQVLRVNGLNFNENAVIQSSIQTRGKSGALFVQITAISADEMADVVVCNIESEEKSSNGEQNNAPPLLDKALPPMPDIASVESIDQCVNSDVTDLSCSEVAVASLRFDPKAVEIRLSSSEIPSSDCGSFTPTSSIRTLVDGTNTGVEIGIAKNISLRVTHGQSQPGLLHTGQTSAISPAARIGTGSVAFNHVASQKQGSPTPRRRQRSGDIGTDYVSLMKQRRVDGDSVKVIAKEPLEASELAMSKPQAILVGNGSLQERILRTQTRKLRSSAASKSMDSSGPGYDNSRRQISHKYGMGPTIRFSIDAHECIMGTQSSRKKIAFEESKTAPEIREPKSRLQSLPTTQTSYRDFAYTPPTHVPSQLSSRQTKEPSQWPTDSSSRARFKKSSPTFAIRSSSLPNPPISLKSSGHKVLPVSADSLTDRLSRPTKASRARAAESKNNLFERGQKGVAALNPGLNQSSSLPASGSASMQTSADIPAASIDNTSGPSSSRKGSKDFKSRIFSIIPTFRRLNHDKVAVPPSAAKPTSSEERNAKGYDTDISRKGVIRRTVSWNLVPAKGGKNPGPPEDFCKPLGDDAPKDDLAANALRQRKDSQHLSPVDDIPGSNRHGGRVSNVVDSTPSAGGVPNSNKYEEPPTPPPSRECPSTDSAKQNLPTKPITTDQTNYDENGVGLYLDQLLEHAESQFRQVVEVGNAATDPQARTAIREILEPLAAAIAATRAARISAIALSNANAELAKYAASLSTQASRAAALTTTKASSLDNSASEDALPLS